jgi:hypothetical protein
VQGWRSRVRVLTTAYQLDFTRKNVRLATRSGEWLAGGLPPIKNIFLLLFWTF